MSEPCSDSPGVVWTGAGNSSSANSLDEARRSSDAHACGEVLLTQFDSQLGNDRKKPWYSRDVQVPISAAQAAQKTVKDPRARSINKLMDIPVVQQRQVSIKNEIGRLSQTETDHVVYQTEEAVQDLTRHALLRLMSALAPIVTCKCGHSVLAQFAPAKEHVYPHTHARTFAVSSNTIETITTNKQNK